ncbi:MAG: hypothetical protein NVS3B14_02170 [Ktedonobacteraceae bacterium]
MVSRHATTGDARSNQDSLPLIMVATTLVAIAARLMETARMTAARMGMRPTGTRVCTLALSNRVCANLTRDGITSAGTTNRGQQTANHASNLARIRATLILAHHYGATKRAATTGLRAVSSATTGHHVDFIVRGGKSAHQDDQIRRIHAGKVARSASRLEPTITRDGRLYASSLKATTNSLTRELRLLKRGTNGRHTSPTSMLHAGHTRTGTETLSS